ncbi:unnamed protein product [Effrenium voratum]|uniref:EF-hand domain-containing protein n=1 Tax=Effrenium voratum TaxID=2562239 RepID=A0AA36JDI0_9DINO|nr:unnamed protein product [Effrenium voratum]
MRVKPLKALEEQLKEVQKQQKESVQGFALLKEQHEAWQSSVDQLLARLTHEENIAVGQRSTESARLLESALHHVQMLELPGGEMDGPAVTYDIDPSVLEAFKFQEKGPLKKVVQEILTDHATKRARTVDLNAWQLMRRRAEQLVNSKWFEWATGILILLNMVTIGIEAEVSVTNPGNSHWSGDMERGFLAIYTVELVLRILAGGLQTFTNGWFLLDFFLVVVGLVALVVAPFLSGDSLEGIEKLLIMRGLRLLRLVRALRMISYFKVMWRLVYSLLTAGGTMLSTTALMLLALYISGCIAVEIISKDEALLTHPDTAPIVEKYFANLGTSSLTLLQFVTLDSIAAIYYPLIMVRPALILFFLPILLVVSIGLMNLVTAVLVENALENAAQEAESERLQLKHKIKGALPTLLEIFHLLDKDFSGSISREEIEHVPIDILPAKLLDSVSIGSMVDLFELLDVDGSGKLSQAEFVEGLLNLVLLDVPIWTIQTLRLLGLLRTTTAEIQEDIRQLRDMAEAGANLNANSRKTTVRLDKPVEGTCFPDEPT